MTCASSDNRLPSFLWEKKPRFFLLYSASVGAASLRILSNGSVRYIKCCFFTFTKEISLRLLDR
jgi:hypothetical protein